MSYSLTNKLCDAERCFIVSEVISGRLSRGMAVKKYGISEVSLWRWIRKFAVDKGDSSMEVEEPKKPCETPEEEIKRLKQELRARKMEADLYREAIALADKEYNLQILKNIGSK